MKNTSYRVVPRIIIFVYFYIFLTTETLSVFGLLRREFIVTLDLMFLTVIVFKYRKDVVDFINLVFNRVRKKLQVVVLLILLFTFVQGLFSAPSTTDSMVYHLPRVMYWLQDGTLNQNIVRNTHDFMPPYAEYLLLHFYSLLNSDKLVFMSQWIAYAISIITSGLVSLQLGAKRKTAEKSALLVALLPIALLQSVSTQSDMIVAVLALLSLYFALEFNRNKSKENALLLGISLGLGMLTKPSFIFIGIIPLGVVIFGLFKNNFRSLQILALFGLLTSSMQYRYWLQNLKLYGTIIGKHITDGKEIIYLNEKIGVNVLISNIVRNLMIHFPVPLGSGYVLLLLERFHLLIITQINDPATTFGSARFKVQTILYPQEDIAGNPLHLVLIILAGFLLYKHKDIFKKSLVKPLFFSLLVSFLLFSVFLKWQPYHSRLHIPLFMIGTIVGVFVLDRFKKGRMLVDLSAILSVPLAFTLIILNVSRPYVSYESFYNLISKYSQPLASIPESFLTKPRLMQYFNARNYWYGPYINMVDRVDYMDDSTISFDLIDEFEYPLWALLKDRDYDGRIVPLSSDFSSEYIMTTSEAPVSLIGYNTECFKTEIDYGYACLSVKVKNE